MRPSSHGEDHAVLRHRRDEDDGRVRREPRARFTDQAVDFFQAEGLQTRRQLAAQLVRALAALLRGAALGQLVLLAHDAEHQQDDHRGRNQDGGEQESDAACPPAAIRRVHRRILGPATATGCCHENVRSAKTL